MVNGTLLMYENVASASASCLPINASSPGCRQALYRDKVAKEGLL
jgi:hypothetical protein